MKLVSQLKCSLNRKRGLKDYYETLSDTQLAKAYLQKQLKELAFDEQ